MRRFVLAAMMFGAASGAHAADLPDLPVLRGSFPDGLSTTTRNWDGWYVGGQGGYASGATDFSHSVVRLTNFIFRNSVLQPPTSQMVAAEQDHAQARGSAPSSAATTSGTISSSVSRRTTATSTISPVRRQLDQRSYRQSPVTTRRPAHRHL